MYICIIERMYNLKKPWHRYFRGLATFGGSLLSGGRYFRDLLAATSKTTPPPPPGHFYRKVTEVTVVTAC